MRVLGHQLAEHRLRVVKEFHRLTGLLAVLALGKSLEPLGATRRAVVQAGQVSVTAQQAPGGEEEDPVDVRGHVRDGQLDVLQAECMGHVGRERGPVDLQSLCARFGEG